MTIYSTVSGLFTSSIVLHCDYDLLVLSALAEHPHSSAHSHQARQGTHFRHPKALDARAGLHLNDQEGFHVLIHSCGQ